MLDQVQATIATGTGEPITATITIVPDHYLLTDVLLGMNILGRAVLSIHYQNHEVIWNNVTYPLRMREHQYGSVTIIRTVRWPEHKAGHYIRLTKRVRLPHHSSEILEITVDESAQTPLLIYPSHRHTQGGLSILSEVSKDKTVHIPVINNTAQTLIFHPGSALACYETNPEVEANLDEEKESVVAKLGESMGENNNLIENAQTRQDKLQTILNRTDWSHLTPPQTQKLFNLIHQHQQLFMLEKHEVGLLKTEPAHIHVSDRTPVRSPIYRYTEKAKQLINEIIVNLEERDIIESSTAAWLSPIVLVNKPSGEKRMCLDYRQVNKHLAVDIHPLPRLEELVENVAGNEYYASLDMKDTYYQVLLDEESRDLTTFTEGVALYRFKRLPFGLSCSPALFSRQLNKVLAPILKQNMVKNLPR